MVAEIVGGRVEEMGEGLVAKGSRCSRGEGNDVEEMRGGEWTDSRKQATRF